MVIPVIVLGTSGTAALIRILRANVLDELRKPYVVTARAKGLPELRLVLKYPVRVALSPLISTVGYILPFLISGSVIVSAVLSLLTLGPVLLKSTLTQDIFMAATVIMLLGLLTVVGTLISDNPLVIINPRIGVEMQWTRGGSQSSLVWARSVLDGQKDHRQSVARSSPSQAYLPSGRLGVDKSSVVVIT